MKEKYTAQAPTTEEAIEKALNALGISKEEAIIDVTQESKKGFLGIGQRDAVVVVTRKEQKSVVEDLVSTRIQMDDDKPSVKPEEKTEPKEEPKNPSEKPKRENKVEVKSKEEAIEEPKEEKETREPSKTNEKDEQAIQDVAKYLERISQKMGVEDVTVSVSQSDRRVHFSIETEDAGLIIGRHGKVLNSLQTLAQIQLHQEADNKLYARVDAENYRERRQKTVEQLAKRTADKVKRTKRPVILEPMPSHERKQIHRFLNHYGGVETHSEGKEPHRYLVVEPADKDDFNI
ncbi:protein jag [Alkalibacterium iburiense]|uniref:RNA-binding protein KhpB n=1 Tax=Alkalibacterium iburiense TaxID=290589 RepID=A0ABN0XP70_9LACT